MSKSYIIGSANVCIDKNAEITEDEIDLINELAAKYGSPKSIIFSELSDDLKSKLTTPTIIPHQDVVYE